jgi:hypothetical protein
MWLLKILMLFFKNQVLSIGNIRKMPGGIFGQILNYRLLEMKVPTHLKAHPLRREHC